MREPAPPYLGEGPHALCHVSEDSAIRRFEPHVSVTAQSDEPWVWAVDTRHLPFFWFPRQCPRAMFWATRTTTPEDGELLGDLLALHAESGIELRIVPSLWPLWNRVVASTLEFSGIRLHNAQPSS